MKLPRFFVLKSNQNNKYLSYKQEDADGNGFLEFSGDEMLSPYTKFQVEKSEQMSSDGLVHIICCFNKKYWVRRSDEDNLIVGAANKPEEDTSKWSCTLFKPIFLGDVIFFWHVQLGHYACLSKASATSCSPLFSVWKDPQHSSLEACTIVDWDSEVVLPKLVLFKGIDDRYVRTLPYGDTRHIVFHNNDKSDQHAWHEIVTHPDRTIQIKAKGRNGEYWSIIESWPEWVFACTSDANDPNTFFIPIKLDNNVIALKRRSTNKFCRRHSDAGHSNFLACDVPNITPDSRLAVEEPFYSCEIYNVRYDLVNAKIDNEYINDTMEQFVSNNADVPTTANLLFSYEETNRKTWDASLSLSIGYSMKVTAGVPEIFGVEAKTSVEFETYTKWGQTFETTTTKEARYTVVVPPKSKIKATLVVRTGLCDVPFSYTQCATLYSGEKVVHEKEDGIYSGANITKLDFEVAKVM